MVEVAWFRSLRVTVTVTNTFFTWGTVVAIGSNGCSMGTISVGVNTPKSIAAAAARKGRDQTEEGGISSFTYIIYGREENVNCEMLQTCTELFVRYAQALIFPFY